MPYYQTPGVPFSTPAQQNFGGGLVDITQNPPSPQPTGMPNAGQDLFQAVLGQLPSPYGQRFGTL